MNNRNLSYFHCFSGISGNMILGALIDLGIDKNHLISELQKLDIEKFDFIAEKVVRGGITATLVEIQTTDQVKKTQVLRQGDLSAHACAVQPHADRSQPRQAGVPTLPDNRNVDTSQCRNNHNQQNKISSSHTLLKHSPHRHLKDIEAIITRSSLSSAIKDKSLAAFYKLAECESSIHGIDINKVHFHELSGIDTIIDVVGSFLCLEMLGIDEVIISPINLGAGFVNCEHGALPVPVPAVLKLLEGKPVYSKFEGELTTPTGALIATSIASSFGRIPQMILLNTGYGAGSSEFSHPNVLCVLLGKKDSVSTETKNKVVNIQTNIDNMNPEIYTYIFERAFQLGALDVFLTQVIMKKNRPGVLLNIICSEEKTALFTDFIFRETTTLGIRILEANRIILQREPIQIDTNYGKVNAKLSVYNNSVKKIMPEYEECARIAREHNKSIVEVMDSIKQTIRDSCKNSVM